MRFTKNLRRFLDTRSAVARLQLAALDLIPHIYTEKMGEKVCHRKDWLSVVIKDAQEVLRVQYDLAGDSIREGP